MADYIKQNQFDQADAISDVRARLRLSGSISMLRRVWLRKQILWLTEVCALVYVFPCHTDSHYIEHHKYCVFAISNQTTEKRESICGVFQYITTKQAHRTNCKTYLCPGHTITFWPQRRETWHVVAALQRKHKATWPERDQTGQDTNVHEFWTWSKFRYLFPQRTMR